MELKFVEDRYDYELQRKEQLNAAMALPVGVLTVLAGAAIGMARTLTRQDPVVTGVFVGILILVIVFFFVCASCLWRAFIAQTYIYLPTLSSLDQWEEDDRQFKSYVESTGGTTPDDDDFSSFLRKGIIEAADANTKSNDFRSKWMHWSRIWLLVVFCLTALAGIPYTADQMRFRMPQAPTQPTTQSQPAASVPQQRPQFPANRVVKEGTIGTQKK